MVNSLNRQKQVEEVTIDMNTAGNSRAFFEGPYEPDYRVKRVIEQAEDDYVQNKLRQEQLDEFYRKQEYEQRVQEALHRQRSNDMLQAQERARAMHEQLRQEQILAGQMKMQENLTALDRE